MLFKTMNTPILHKSFQEAGLTFSYGVPWGYPNSLQFWKRKQRFSSAINFIKSSSSGVRQTFQESALSSCFCLTYPLSLMFPTLFLSLFKIIIALLRYDSHTIELTHLKCTSPWLSDFHYIYLQFCTLITMI